jgi:hypothetical protein
MTERFGGFSQLLAQRCAKMRPQSSIYLNPPHNNKGPDCSIVVPAFYSILSNMVKSLEVEFGAINEDNIEQVCQKFVSS